MPFSLSHHHVLLYIVLAAVALPQPTLCAVSSGGEARFYQQLEIKVRGGTQMHSTGLPFPLAMQTVLWGTPTKSSRCTAQHCQVGLEKLTTTEQSVEGMKQEGSSQGCLRYAMDCPGM